MVDHGLILLCKNRMFQKTCCLFLVSCLFVFFSYFNEARGNGNCSRTSSQRADVQETHGCTGRGKLQKDQKASRKQV